jgi:hypothetical protein
LAWAFSRDSHWQRTVWIAKSIRWQEIGTISVLRILKSQIVDNVVFRLDIDFVTTLSLVLTLFV